MSDSLSPIWMRHVAPMSRVGMSRTYCTHTPAATASSSRHVTYEWVMSHIWMSHTTQSLPYMPQPLRSVISITHCTNESCLPHEWVTPHKFSRICRRLYSPWYQWQAMWMSHVSHEWVTGQINSRICRSLGVKSYQWHTGGKNLRATFQMPVIFYFARKGRYGKSQGDDSYRMSKDETSESELMRENALIRKNGW